MNSKHILGIVLIVIAIGSFLGGTYIGIEVDQGSKKVQNAQAFVDVGSALSQTHKDGKYARAALKPVQTKVDEGKMKVQKYDLLSIWMQISGGAIFLVGAVLFILGFFSKL